MFSMLFENIQKTLEHSEGDLYKIITTFGKKFELRYGYYEEGDRRNPLCEPVLIYPDFLKDPVYTEDGRPFVTMMQDACKCYAGETRQTFDTTCAECKYFSRGEELFGVCTCLKNQIVSDQYNWRKHNEKENS